MATQWHYQLNDGRESDAVSFRELADLIQAGVLSRTSLVHPHYDAEWRAAEDVVGLIYTAENVPDGAVASWPSHAEPRENIPDSETVARNQQSALTGDDTLSAADIVVLFSRRSLIWILDIFVLLTGRRDISPAFEGGENAPASATAGPELKDAGLRECAREVNHSVSVSAIKSPFAERIGRDALVPDKGTEETAFSQLSLAVAENSTVFDLDQLLGDGMLAHVEEVPVTAETHDPEAIAVTSTGVMSLDAGCDNSSTEGLGQAMEDAVRDWDDRHVRAETAGKFGRTVGRSLPGWSIAWMEPQFALLAFRIAAAIVCANLSVFAIEVMASSESRRFPGWLESRNVRSFPLIGECSPFEFWFLAVDSGLIVGAVVFVLTRRISLSDSQ